MLITCVRSCSLSWVEWLYVSGYALKYIAPLFPISTQNVHVSRDKGDTYKLQLSSPISSVGWFGFNGNWTTRGYANSRIANSRTGRLADWTSRVLVQFASWLVRELSSPRVDQSARCPVRELAIRELAYPRVVQLPLQLYVSISRTVCEILSLIYENLKVSSGPELTPFGGTLSCLA